MSTTLDRTTADDRLNPKNRGTAAISGGDRLVRAPKAPVANTIFTLCGAHGTARRV